MKNLDKNYVVNLPLSDVKLLYSTLSTESEIKDLESKLIKNKACYYYTLKFKPEESQKYFKAIKSLETKIKKLKAAHIVKLESCHEKIDGFSDTQKSKEKVTKLKY